MRANRAVIDRELVTTRPGAGIQQRERARLSDRQSLLVMAGLGVGYIVLGLAVPEALFSWFEGAAFLVAGAFLVARLRNRGR